MNPIELKDKIPPHNNDAEMATLGALLLDSEALSVVLRYLRADDFYKLAHQKIFTAIVGLFNEAKGVDLLTLTDELRSEGSLENSGGTAYVSSLTSVVPTSANVEYYAKIVQENSIRRLLLKIAGEMVSSAHDDSLDGRSVIEEAEKKIFAITDSQQKGQYRVAMDIIPEAISAIEQLYHRKESYTGVPTGFTELDNMTSGFQNSEFIIIGARPSIGKTALALTMAANMAINNKIPVGFFTLEMSEMALMNRLIASESRISSTNLRSGMLKPNDFHNLTEAAGRIYEAPLYIDDTPNMKLLDLRAQARRMLTKEGVKIIFVDYIGLIEPESKNNVPRHEQVAEISRSLKSLAREMEVPIVCLSQVGRQSEGKPPSLADLRESGSIEQDADVVMFLHREKDSDQTDGHTSGPINISTDLIIAKQRNGPIGTVPIVFIPKYTRFENLSRDSG
ncbi:MAG: replicative DNA helicase [Spirochaetota bacterium]|nr:replicative DNA helicase [Spirochaetota bacterium]